MLWRSLNSTPRTTSFPSFPGDLSAGALAEAEAEGTTIGEPWPQPSSGSVTRQAISFVANVVGGVASGKIP
jgi:hypothetical protein